MMVVGSAIQFARNTAGVRELSILLKHNESRTYVLICINIRKIPKKYYIAFPNTTYYINVVVKLDRLSFLVEFMPSICKIGSFVLLSGVYILNR